MRPFQLCHPGDKCLCAPCHLYSLGTKQRQPPGEAQSRLLAPSNPSAG